VQALRLILLVKVVIDLFDRKIKRDRSGCRCDGVSDGRYCAWEVERSDVAG